MKKIILFLSAIFLVQTSFGQERVADSIVEKKIDSLVILVRDLWNKDLDSAERVAKYLLSYSSKNNNLRGIARSYGTLGSVYDNMGNGGKSLAYNIKAKDAFASLGDEIMVNKLRNNIGLILIGQREYKEARKYVQNAHDYFFKIEKYKNLPNIYLSLATIDINTNKSLKVIMKNLNKAEKFSIKRKDTLALCLSLNLQGEAYIKNNKKFPLAISRIEKAIKLIKIKEPNDHFNLGYSYLHLGKAYWKKKAYEKALFYNDSSLFHYKKYNYSQGLLLAYENRKNIFSDQGNYKQSNEAFENFNKYKDSVFKKDRTNQMVRLKTEYETDQIITQKEAAEAKVKLTEAISKQNKNNFIGAVIIGFLILMSAVFYFKRFKATKKIELITLEFNENEKRLVIEKQLVASKLESLQAQMNPHFTFNALNSIQNLVLKGDKYEAYDYLTKFSNLIRENLNMSRKSYVSFDDELQMLTKYLDLEQLRFQDNFTYTITGDEEINDIKIPTAIIQPYIENAIKHGLLHKTEGERKLSLTFVQEEVLTCIVADNGVGMAASEKIKETNGVKRTSFSTSAIEERMTFLREYYKTDIGVFYEQVTEGTKVVIKIPYTIF